jgi:carboxypeptidase Taq
MKNNSKYQAFETQLQKVADLGFANSVLGWDQQTYMPKNGGQFRGQQMATLSTLGHEIFVDPKFGELLKELAQDSTLTDDQRLNVELTQRDYLRKKKYPHAFVEEHARVCADAFSSWHEARTFDRFSTFEPVLKKIVDLKRQETQFLGFKEHPYEALLEDYEPGLTVKKIDEVFAEVKTQLFPFIKQIMAKEKPRHDFLARHYPKDKQWNFSEKMVKQMGYDFNSGRADFAPHPFCTTFGPGDVRITIRVDEHHFNQMFFAAIHEAGHGLYEMSLPLAQYYGQPLGQALSLAFHESQSRFWENKIARSEPYWKGNFQALQQEFPENLTDVTESEFYKGVNLVEPSFIRVEADELTYHAHIYIRYLIEKALIEGQIEVSDVPQFWNDRYEEYLGIRPTKNSEGCLQDVHWSYGSFGYFPTYSFGSFYAAQLHATMKKEIPHFDSSIESRDLAPLSQWLKEKVHVHGRRMNSQELLKTTTGSDLKFSYFMDYARAKYGAIYGI